MDVLKYWFDLDPVDPIRRRLQLRKQKKKKRQRKPIVAIRFIYVDKSAEQPTASAV